MIDRIFFTALSFCLFVVASLTVAAALFAADGPTAARAADATPASMVRVVQLPRVVVIAKRLAADSTLASTGASEPASQRAQ